MTPTQSLFAVVAGVGVLLGATATPAVASTTSVVTWAQQHPKQSPPARDSAAIAADGATTVMFGGETQSGGKVLGDTWTWTKGKWSQQTSSTHPPALAGASMAFDPTTNAIVLFGGKKTSGATSSETWLWSSGKWSEAKVKTAPPARAGAEMAYSPVNKGVLLYSGLALASGSFGRSALKDTWLWTRSGWRKLAPKASPPGSLFGTMVTDTASDQVLLFTGLVSATSKTAPGETWVWNGSTWERPKLSAHPSSRIGPSSAYDPARREPVLYGGYRTKALSDLWAWTGSSWAELTEKPSPPPRAVAAMAYDASSKRLLIFGGSTQPVGPGGPKDLSDTWLGGP